MGQAAFLSLLLPPLQPWEISTQSNTGGFEAQIPARTLQLHTSSEKVKRKAQRASDRKRLQPLVSGQES